MNYTKDLRKAVKIKAVAVLFAWLVIFAHSIIPHNHLQGNESGCQELFHETSAAESNIDLTSKFEKQPDEINVCHFSNFLFNQFNQDNLIIPTNRETHFYPVLLCTSLMVHNIESFLSRPYFGSSSLRAPPAA